MAEFPHGRILMSSPREFSSDSYDVTYRINAWMNPEKDKVNKSKALKQWQTLRNTISRLGAFVDVIHVPFPDGVFSANAGLVHRRQFVASTFKYHRNSYYINIPHYHAPYYRTPCYILHNHSYYKNNYYYYRLYSPHYFKLQLHNHHIHIRIR